MGPDLSVTKAVCLSCYTMARAFPLLPAPAPSFPCHGASPYPWKSRPGNCPQGLCSPGIAHTGEGLEPVEGRVVENGVGRRGRGPLSSCFCLLSTCEGGAFICSLTDCQGETWLSLPLQGQDSAQGNRPLPPTQAKLLASVNACFLSTRTPSLPLP